MPDILLSHVSHWKSGRICRMIPKRNKYLPIEYQNLKPFYVAAIFDRGISIQVASLTDARRWIEAQERTDKAVAE